jgi:hypothetical protein
VVAGGSLPGPLKLRADLRFATDPRHATGGEQGVDVDTLVAALVEEQREGIAQ